MGPSVGVMALVAALRIHTDGNAGGGFSLTLLGRGMGWGNAGVGNLTVGFVPKADVVGIILFYDTGNMSASTPSVSKAPF